MKSIIRDCLEAHVAVAVAKLREFSFEVLGVYAIV